ncbi:MAG TPA: lytic transglycosylase domain-containing protein [Hyphomicrobiales bacterium]|nr:lytic transglycosylase domain-containing protein [Hyphomicrobiales bacterium]
MNTWSVSGVTDGIIGAIRKAAEATGSGFSYLLHTGAAESGLNPTAKAPTSSAAGLFQFTKDTWLETLKQEGPSLGLGGLAAQITKSGDGQYTVADPAQRQAILKLRNDPTVSALMAGALAQKNGATLTAALGRVPSDGELYIAHFLGAQGATQLLSLAQKNPGASAVAAFPAAAAANPSVFYANGQARSVGEVRATLIAREGAAKMPATSTALAFSGADDGSAGNDTTQVDEQGPVFHSIFRSGRRAPIAAYVDAVWSGLGPASAFAGGAASALTTTAPAAAVPKAAAGAVVHHRAGAPLNLLGFIRPAGSGAQ